MLVASEPRRSGRLSAPTHGSGTLSWGEGGMFVSDGRGILGKNTVFDAIVFDRCREISANFGEANIEEKSHKTFFCREI